MNRLLLLALISTLPASAIVITTGDPNSSAYTVGYQESVGGVNLSGVVKITSSRGGCTGSLLGDGYSILTAAHCITTAYGAPVATGITANFQGPSGFVPLTVDLTFVDPAYTGDATVGGDLAVLRLTGLAPSYATRYSLFSGLVTTDPIVLAGYGYSGTGATGYNSGTYGFGTLRAGTNAYVLDGSEVGWSDSLLLGQFYDANQPLTNGLESPNPYTSADEVMIAPGDSGGPSFYNGSLVGVHDLIVCFSPENSSNCSVPPSVSTTLNASYGQIFADVSVSSNAEWIQAQMVPEPGTWSFSVSMTLLVLARRYIRGLRK